MTPEQWHERLEAYLDGELAPREAAAFEGETAADPELARQLAGRRRLREAARAVLGEGSAAGSGRLVAASWRRLGWVALAAAAVLALLLLNGRHTGEPSAVALVTAPRLGEQPGVTHELAAGRMVLPGGF